MLPEQWFDYKTLDLKEGEAKAYLSGEAPTIQTDKGVVVMSYKGVPLGFGKSNGKRINNLYPKHLRVLGI